MKLVERRHPEHPFKRSFWNEFTWPAFLREHEVLPAINIKENDNSYELELAVPGYKKEDFKVNIEKGMMTIQAEVKEETEEKKDDYSRKEFSYRSFEKSFTIPEHVDEESIQAKFENGILKIALPKTSKEALAEPKKLISIQ